MNVKSVSKDLELTDIVFTLYLIYLHWEVYGAESYNQT